MGVFGSSIGEGNYQPMQNEFISFEKYRASAKMTGSMHYTESGININLEADSNGAIPKDAKAVAIRASCNDSGSAAGVAYFITYGNLGIYALAVTLSGLTDNAIQYSSAITQPCDSNGDINYSISATGAETFYVAVFRYQGVQL